MGFPKIYVLGSLNQATILADRQAADLHIPRRQQHRITRRHQLSGLGGLLVITEAFLREHLTEGERELLWSRLPGDIGIKPAYTAILVLLNGWEQQPPGEGRMLLDMVEQHTIPRAVFTHGVKR